MGLVQMITLSHHGGSSIHCQHVVTLGVRSKLEGAVQEHPDVGDMLITLMQHTVGHFSHAG